MPTTNIHGVYVNGITYPIYDQRFGTSSTPTVVSQVEVEPLYDGTGGNGVEVGNIIVDGITTTLYAPLGNNDKVNQVITSTNATYPIAFAYPTTGITTPTVTNAIRRDNSFNYNPSTKLLQTGALGVTVNLGYTTVVPTTTTGYNEGQVMFVILNE